MYKLLLATNQKSVRDVFAGITEWTQLNFSPIISVASADEAISVMETQCVDAVGYSLDKYGAAKLHQYLTDKRPSLPVFQVWRSREKQLKVLRDVSRTLDTMHADFSDDNYNEEAMLDILREELTHRLLAGEVATREELSGQLQLLRSHVADERACVLYEIDLPQGEVYLADRWHYGRERLENALRNHFFGRYEADVYYGVAVLTPRHIRLIACQRLGAEKDDAEFTHQAMSHVEDAIARVKEFLDLDLCVEEAVAIPGLSALVPEQK